MSEQSKHAPEQIEKAALFFDHIQKAREAGKDWWADALERMISESVEQDRIRDEMLDVIEEAAKEADRTSGRITHETYEKMLAVIARAKGKP